MGRVCLNERTDQKSTVTACVNEQCKADVLYGNITGIGGAVSNIGVFPVCGPEVKVFDLNRLAYKDVKGQTKYDFSLDDFGIHEYIKTSLDTESAPNPAGGSVSINPREDLRQKLLNNCTHNNDLRGFVVRIEVDGDKFILEKNCKQPFPEGTNWLAVEKERIFQVDDFVKGTVCNIIVDPAVF